MDFDKIDKIRVCPRRSAAFENRRGLEDEFFIMMDGITATILFNVRPRLLVYTAIRDPCGHQHLPDGYHGSKCTNETSCFARSPCVSSVAMQYAVHFLSSP